MEGVVSEIIGTIVIEGITYLVKKGVDGIISIFIDEDNDGEPDFPELPDVEFPVDTETQIEKSIIIVSPDGTMCIYDDMGNIQADDCELAYSLWLSENSIVNKNLDNYSVTEGLLALILVFLGLNFVRGLFAGKDVFR